MLSPNPVPCLFYPLVSASLLKLWNSFPIFSYEMPIPESLTITSKDM